MKKKYQIIYAEIGVIAGTYDEYMGWKHRDYDWGQKSFYVFDAIDLRGRSGDILVLVIGTGTSKHELIDEAKERGFEVRSYG